MEGGGEKDGGLGCGDGEEDGMGGSWIVGESGDEGADYTMYKVGVRNMGRKY